MKILVFVKAVRDTKVTLEYDQKLSDLRRSGSLFDINPADLTGISQALAIKSEIPGLHITAIHLGPEEGDRWIREALSYGFDDGIRVWDEAAGKVNAPAKALVFSRIAELLGFDLIFTGDTSLDTASGQTGILIAERFGIPCISSVVSVSMKPDQRTLLLKRILARGYEEQVECLPPAVITTRGTASAPVVFSFDSLFNAATEPINCWDFAKIGLPRAAVTELNSLLEYGKIREVAPRLIPIEVPDSNLSSFERVSRLLGATMGKREGKVIKTDDDHAADEIFKLLLECGVLNKTGAA